MTADVRGSTWRKRFCFVSETRSVAQKCWLQLKFHLRRYDHIPLQQPAIRGRAQR